MSGRWLIRIASWPYSTDEGAAVAQSRAGPREQRFIVQAEDIRGALRLAEIFRDGMLTNPMVWNAPIQEVREARHDEQASFTRPCVTSIREAKAKSVSPPSQPDPAGSSEGER